MGSFVLYPYWLMCHRRVPLGIIFFLMQFVPFASLMASIYFGMKGTDIAINCGRFRDEAQFIAVENAWRDSTFFFLALPVLFFIGSIAGVFLRGPTYSRPF